ncbi:MAG: hypothetical protein GC134_09990 [Proteobacteria bacterium]|nr:hypothetical protein [Pseudomonadota bacterium]
MEFVARAGYAIDRAHRLTGFFMIISVVLAFALVMTLQNNSALNRELTRLRNEAPVYVVPDSIAGFYEPRSKDMLLTSFVDYVAKMLNEYTPTSLQQQYNEVRQFFTPATQILAEKHFADQIKKVQSDERAAVLVIERNTLKNPVKLDKKGDMGGDLYEVKFNALRQEMLGNTVVDQTPLEITLWLEQSFVSKTNPFGFLVAKYSERQLAGLGDNAPRGKK